uniref:Uncharacterized protein n=1 Tax=Trypanosoma vivax (strain Y486) TaxID=1055687 RepID=G0U3Q2_TRYVY|nr:hypothetical protein, conserved in T. vivax [Trypanosoma vivax Y486]
MLSLRASGAPQLDAFCLGGSRALLEAKGRAAAPETMGSGADMVLDSAAEENGKRFISKPVALRGPWPGERQSQIAEEAARGFGERVAALENVPPTLKPLKASINDTVVLKVPSRDPHLVASVSEANRVAKGMWTGPAWEQRVSIMRRFGEFTKKRGPEMSEGHVPLFIVSLKLAKSRTVLYARALLSLTASGRTLARMFLSGLRGAAAENPTRRARPVMRRELGPVCDAVGSERGRVAVRLAWVTAGRWDEIALLREGNFIGRPSDRNALTVNLGLCQKHSRRTRADQHASWRLRVRTPTW